MAKRNNRVKTTSDLELKDRLVAINRVTKVTKGGRAFTFAAIVVVGDENGVVTGIECVTMELGEPDASGRRKPVVVEGSNHVIPVDMVIMSIGTKLNTLILDTTKDLEANKKGGIGTDDAAATNRPGIFAGGDAVTGAATVITAMGAGKKAAASIDEFLSK